MCGWKDSELWKYLLRLQRLREGICQLRCETVMSVAVTGSDAMQSTRIRASVVSSVYFDVPG